MGETGAGSADVIKLTPDNPQADALRQKFLYEHIHTEDEVRFFVHGAGNFIMHVDGRVYDAHCDAGRPDQRAGRNRSTGSTPARSRSSPRCGCSPTPSGWVAALHRRHDQRALPRGLSRVPKRARRAS